MGRPRQVTHYREFCRYREQGEANNSVDLTNCSFMYPTTMLPLLAYASKFKWNLEINPHSNAGRYLSYMLRRSGSPVGGSTYLAPVKLPPMASDGEKVLEELYSLQTKSKFVRNNEVPFKYTIAELADNIYEHSEFQHAYVMAQKYSQGGGYIELCFLDDGVSIPGSFEKVGKHYDPPAHKNAILNAIRGASTKPGGGRGYGLSTNVEMFRDIGGEVLIVSGYGAIYIDKGSVIPYTLDAKSRMDGTLISLRVQDRPRIVKLYEYVQARSSV